MVHCCVPKVVQSDNGGVFKVSWRRFFIEKVLRSLIAGRSTHSCKAAWSMVTGCSRRSWWRGGNKTTRQNLYMHYHTLPLLWTSSRILLCQTGCAPTKWFLGVSRGRNIVYPRIYVNFHRFRSSQYPTPKVKVKKEVQGTALIPLSTVHPAASTPMTLVECGRA